MKQIQPITDINIDFSIKLILTVHEAEALDALTEYDINAFLDVFYKHLGKEYLKPNEDGIRSLFAKVKKYLPGEIGKIEKATVAIQAALADINK